LKKKLEIEIGKMVLILLNTCRHSYVK